MIVFGGKTASGAVNDVWLVNLRVAPNDSLEWKQVTISGDVPPARYGHTAVLVRDLWAQPMMLVFGGKNGATSFVGDTVWALRIQKASGGSFSWRRIYASGSPGQLEGHSAIAHELGTTHRMIVFGGEKGSGGLKDSLYKFDLAEDTTATWSYLPTDSTPPAPRTRHAAALDKEWNRMVVFGGDTTTTTGSGASNTMWGLPLSYAAGTNPGWKQILPDTTVPAARWGHTLVFDPRRYDARFVEVYHPTVGSIGAWEKHTVEGKWLPPYPFMFNLSNGDLFFAGNGPEFTVPPKDNSFTYSISNKTWGNQKASGALGGSAVIWPALNDSDRVMKCGGDDDVTDTVEVKTRMFTVGASGWIGATDLAESRTYHNLTHLPNGKALLTGGRERSGNGAAFTKIPRMFDPVTRTWGANLTADPGNRGYHSSALLLPDARVLCAGGPGPGSGTFRATIFSPPYLFNYNSSQLATRPTITTYPTYTLHYNEPMYFSIGGLGGSPNDSIASLCLVRPGAPTHGFDQNQRYHQLTFGLSPYGNLRAVLTGNADLIPPGDYLLFAVKKGPIGVPSVAKWVRVNNENDQTAPGTVSDLDYGPNYGDDYYMTWTTPGDDGIGPGAAMAYEVRNSSAEITNQNWSSASVIASDVSMPAGDGHLMFFEGCIDGYFAVRNKDENNQWSSVSSNTGWDCGGGMSATKAQHGSFGATPASSRESGGTRERILMLPGTSGRALASTLVNAGSDSIRVDALEVFESSDQGDTLAVVVNGALGQGVRQAPTRVWSSRSGDVTASLTGDGTGYAGVAGETLTVYRQSGGSAYLWLETASANPSNHPGATGVAVEVVGTEGWTRAAVCFPGYGEDARLIPGVFADSVRLVLLGGYRLKSVDAIEPKSGTPATHGVSTALGHSRLGTVAPGSEVVLRAGERATATVAGTSESSGRRRFLRVRTSLPAAASSAAARPASPSMPTVFGLSQNEPNPFGEGTLIRFALPVKSNVRLEVFDVSGRRIKTLTHGEWPAGYHTLTWNGEDIRGGRVSPGVYLYRMEAGSYEKSRKLVMSP